MNINAVYKHLDNLIPVEEIPISWDNMGYTSKAFNKHVSSPNFKGWSGDIPTDQEAKIIAELLPIKPNESLLDVACGYGRHSLYLAQHYNLKVTGIDISPGLIETATRLANEQKLKIHFEVRAAKNINWEKKFSYAIIVSNSFSLFNPLNAAMIMSNIWKALMLDGRIFLDLDNKPFYCEKNASHRDWEVLQNCIKLQEVYYHKEKSVETCRDIYFYIDSNEIENFVIFKHLYTEDEIRSILHNSGFNIIEVFGGWDLSTLQDNSQKIIIVAEKWRGN